MKLPEHNPIEFCLSNAVRDRCALYSIDVERQRRKRNELDEKMRKARETRALMKSLYYDGGPDAA